MISIVIPTFNDSDFFLEVIIALEEQTYSNMEVIVVDSSTVKNSSNIIQERLKESGLNRLTVSLDSLNQETFQRVSGTNYTPKDVLNGISNARKAGFENIKINMVVKKDINHKDIIPMLDNFKDTGCIVRFIEFTTISRIVVSITLVFVIDLFLSPYLEEAIRQLFPFILKEKVILTRESWVIGFLLSLVFIAGSRLIATSFLSEKSAERRVVIYGAGSAGIQLVNGLRFSKEMKAVAFVDSNKDLHNTFISGIEVVSPKNLKKLIKRNKIDEVLIAMPSVAKSTLRNLLNEIEKFSIKVRILPGVEELAQGKVSVSELKEVDINDLLGREEVNADQELIKKNIREKVVMVTGAGGSIGSEISRQVLQNKPKLLIIFDLNEYSLYTIRQELEDKKTRVKIKSILGDVRDQNRVKEVCETFGVETIYHSAAYKHVPLVEENPFEAVSNNIFGTLNCVLAANKSKVQTFVLISTDKAVRPTNIMGATKRFAELILQSLSAKNSAIEDMKISMVRFGNVLGSSGSAIPLFQKQIREGGPLTVTDPKVIRYFMSISEAAELVIQAGAMGTGGDVFVLDMGEPVLILDLAEKLIRFSGMEIKSEQNPKGDIEIIFTGLRSGEKLFEELLIGDNVDTTEHGQIYRADEDFINWDKLDEYLNMLREAESSSDHEELRSIFKQTVSGYKPEKEIVDVIYLQQRKSS